MNITYSNTFNSERSVEIEFFAEKISQFSSSDLVLDCGGIPSVREFNKKMYDAITSSKCIYKISDFRGGDYHGDFVHYNFGETKFDKILFLSSLEHFPQCTEGDMVFRRDEDRAGFQKALSILKDGGEILLTVPFGKCEWFSYHYSYNMDRILFISEGSTITEQYIYTLKNNEWVLTNIEDTQDIRNPGPVNGVGLFVFRK